MGLQGARNASTSKRLGPPQPYLGPPGLQRPRRPPSLPPVPRGAPGRTVSLTAGVRGSESRERWGGWALPAAAEGL